MKTKHGMQDAGRRSMLALNSRPLPRRVLCCACVFDGYVHSVLVHCDATSLFNCTELATLCITCLFTVHFRINYCKINLSLLDRVDFYVRYVWNFRPSSDLCLNYWVFHGYVASRYVSCCAMPPVLKYMIIFLIKFSHLCGYTDNLWIIMEIRKNLST